jgi:hypothetical protein
MSAWLAARAGCNTPRECVTLLLLGRMNFLEFSKLLFPTGSGLLPKSSVVAIDRVPSKFSTFLDLSFEKPIQCSNIPWVFCEQERGRPR